MIPALSLGINFLFQGLVLLVIVAARDEGASGTMIGAVLGLVGAVWFWAVLLPVLAVAPRPYGVGVVFSVMLVLAVGMFTLAVVATVSSAVRSPDVGVA